MGAPCVLGALLAWADGAVEEEHGQLCRRVLQRLNRAPAVDRETRSTTLAAGWSLATTGIKTSRTRFFKLMCPPCCSWYADHFASSSSGAARRISCAAIVAS